MENFQNNTYIQLLLAVSTLIGGYASFIQLFQNKTKINIWILYSLFYIPFLIYGLMIGLNEIYFAENNRELFENFFTIFFFSISYLPILGLIKNKNFLSRHFWKIFFYFQCLIGISSIVAVFIIASIYTPNPKGFTMIILNGIAIFPLILANFSYFKQENWQSRK